ncbi:hypothetical protein [Mycobacterium sp.]|uniref:hypothetical protein n=1 Tax=Mycobacterium sp. TaxID=1785 RepID=UPI002CE8D6F8|nr:hypothetical protein [Mycobacterium sp.]HTY35250.1 hypothetical protein [Mycobacterium sp.]
MTNRKGRLAAAACGGAALVFAVGFGVGGVQDAAGEQPNSATSPSSGTAPSGSDGGGALPVQPVGGGACIIGLNCGCIPRITCPTPHARPGTAGTNQHNAPAPQNP